jgi:hypothetical protein
MASTEGSGILETGNLETSKRALDAEGFRHFQILRLVFKSEMTRCAQAQPGKSSSDPDRAQRTRSSARKVQLSLKTGSPSLRRAWQAYNHALEEVSKEENSRPVENNKLLLAGSRQRPFLSTFFGASTDIYLIS